MLAQTWSSVRLLAASLLLVGSLASAENKLEPAGLAVYTDTARDIYMAGLLVVPGRSLENIDLAPGPMSMEYRIATRRISSRGFSGTLLLQAELGSGERAPEQVVSALSDLKQRIQGSLLQGDQFLISLTEAEETAFYLNGEELLTVNDGSIFDFLFSGWVGDSSSALFRDRLLAGTVDPGVLMRYESLVPSAERVIAVAEWSAAPLDEATGEPEPTPEVIASAEKPTADETVAQVANSEPAAEAAVAATAVVAATTAATAAEAIVEQTTTTAEDTVAAAETDAVETAAADAEAEETPVTAAPDPVNEAPVKEMQVAMLNKPVEDDSVLPRSIAETIQMDSIMDDREYQRQLNNYIAQVMRQVFREVRYPRRAVEKQRQGNVDLLAQFTEAGELIDVSIDATSGYGPLDKAAVKAVRKAAPFPELTDVAREEFMAEDGNGYVMMIPVKFVLQE